MLFRSVAVQFVIGLVMPHIRQNTPYEGLVAWHIMLGTATLILLIVRLAWRFTHPVPPALPMPRWQETAARHTH
mgnify:CR=1 FL=1